MEKNMNILAETLIRGRDSAKRLQNLLYQKGRKDDVSISIDDLVMEISKSVTEGLSVLNSCGFGEICGPSVGLACSSDHKSEVITGNSEKILTPLVKESRGRYKRRKNVNSSVKVSDTSEDGYVWRKYGQKEIINSRFPRCYFRCTYKDDQGCMALKHVQQLEGESNKFRIKYFGFHTCTTTPQHIASHSAVGPGVLLDFEGLKNNRFLVSNPLTPKNTQIKPLKKPKVPPNKVSSPNDSRPSTSLVSNDILLADFSPYSEPPLSDHGEYSSPSIVSNGFLETHFFENDEILVDDDTMVIIESLWD